MQIINLNKISFFMVFFLPTTYIVGIAVTEIFFFVLLVYFLLQKDIKLYFFDKKFLFLIIFSFYVCINAVIQIDHRDLLYSSIFYFRYPLLALLVYFFYEKFDYLPKKELLIHICFLFYFIIFIDSFFQFFYGYNFLGNKVDDYRVSSFFGEELVLGGFLIKLLPFFIWGLIYAKINFKNYFLFLTFFFFLYFSVIYISGGRSAIGLMIISIVFILLFVKNLRKIFTFSTILLLMFVILTSFFNIGKSNVYGRVFEKTFNDITNNILIEEKNTNNNILENKLKKKDLKIFSRDHHGHYTLALDLFKNNYLFGVAPKGFRYHCRKIEYDSKVGICTTHPHNILIQFLSELGIVGLIFYLYGLIFTLYSFLKIYKKKIDLELKDGLNLSSLAILINFFPFLPSGDFFNNWISITCFYSIGIFIYSYNKANNK